MSLSVCCVGKVSQLILSPIVENEIMIIFEIISDQNFESFLNRFICTTGGLWLFAAIQIARSFFAASVSQSIIFRLGESFVLVCWGAGLAQW